MIDDQQKLQRLYDQFRRLGWNSGTTVEAFVDELVPVLKAHLGWQPPEGWRDMSSAPKDGTKIIGSDEEDSAFICAWYHFEDNGGDWLQYGSDVVHPKLWMPLPAPDRSEGS